MIDMFLNSLLQTDVLPGCSDNIRVLRKLMSLGVHALYLIFLRAVLSLASSGLCFFCLMFCHRMTTVVIWCHSALPMASSWDFLLDATAPIDLE